jgi:hypothetical protein
MNSKIVVAFPPEPAREEAGASFGERRDIY